MHREQDVFERLNALAFGVLKMGNVEMIEPWLATHREIWMI